MSASQPNEPNPPTESSPVVPSQTTPPAATQTTPSLPAQSSVPRGGTAEESTQTTPPDAAQNAHSLLGAAPIERRLSPDAPVPAPITALGTTMAQTIPLPLSPPPVVRESLGDSFTSANQVGFSRATVSLHEQPSASRIAQASHPRAESLQEPSADVLRPALTESSKRGAEPTFPSPTILSHHSRRESIPSRGLPRIGRLHPAQLDAPLPLPPRDSRPVPVPPTNIYRRSGVTYPDSETVWQTRDEFQREKTVAERLQPTIDAAIEEKNKSEYQAKWTNLAINIAIGLQVFIGALTTGLGASLSGKNSAAAISVLGGAATLVASYLARTRGSSEPEFSILRTTALEHFVREIEGFTLDYGNEVGHQWDEKVNGFRLGFENILGNRPGSLAIKGEGGDRPDANTSQRQEKGIGKSDAIAGFSGNEKYPVSGTNTKLAFSAV